MSNIPPIHHLSARQLSCERGNGVLFSNVSFNLTSGQALIVTGENGSGKTSLLKMLTGLSQPVDGNVLWNHTEIHQQITHFQRQLLYIGHQSAIKNELSVRENLQLALKLWPTESAMTIVQLAEQVGLRKRLSVQCGRLSAGQQRRVALARLFITQQKLWILDEPLTALDQEFRETIELLLTKHLHNEGLLVLTTHREINIEPDRLVKLTLGTD